MRLNNDTSKRFFLKKFSSKKIKVRHIADSTF